jgi:hypothetical protein
MPSTAFWPANDANPTGSEVLRPLAPVASKVLVAAGLDVKVMMDIGRKYDGHFSYSSLWTGTYKNLGLSMMQFATAAGPSLDQVYSDFVAKQVNLPIPMMVTATVGGGQYTGGTSRRTDGSLNTAETDPVRLFTRAFASASLPADQVDKLKLRRKSILDFVSKDLTGFGGRLGADDKGKVNAHLDAVRQLELQLSAAPAKSCQGTAPTGTSDYPGKTKAFLDLTALAIRCDLTRSVSMVWGADGGSGPGSFPFLGITGDYHGIAHQGPGGYANKIKIDTWYYTQVAYLAQQLDGIMELGGSALDHSVIGVTTDMNEGAAHYNGRLPFVLIGSAGGYLKQGRVVKLGTWAGKTGSYWNGDSGVANNKLLATLANALDMPGESFGTGFAGVLPDLRA